MRTFLFALPLLAACSGAADDTGKLSGDATAGADIYDANCASCHGASGEGGTGPAMADVVAEFPDSADLTDIIRNGTDEGMPAFTTDQLSDQDVADVVAYMLENY